MVRDLAVTSGRALVIHMLTMKGRKIIESIGEITVRALDVVLGNNNVVA
jgi:hypothetical protein